MATKGIKVKAGIKGIYGPKVMENKTKPVLNLRDPKARNKEMAKTGKTKKVA